MRLSELDVQLEINSGSAEATNEPAVLLDRVLDDVRTWAVDKMSTSEMFDDETVTYRKIIYDVNGNKIGWCKIIAEYEEPDDL